MRLLLLLGLTHLATALDLPPLPDWYDTSKLPPGWPGDPSSYMVDNTGNTFGVAPDKGKKMIPRNIPKASSLTWRCVQ
jgi:hypothetical protein